MNVFGYLTSSCLLGARCGSWVLFIVTLVNLCSRSLSLLFLHSLDFSIYNPAVYRQWWFCFYFSHPVSSVTLPCMLTWAGAGFVKHG